MTANIQTPSWPQTTQLQMWTSAIAKFDFIGFHCWPEASGVRDYLAQRHRHKFIVQAEIETRHDDREIEFHDFLDFCKNNTPRGDLGRLSCEQIGRQLVQAVAQRWPGRVVDVQVWEDGEVGARVYSKT